MNVLFMGTPDFAVECLERLLCEGHNICGVFCQPDKPKGRKHVLTPPPTKIFAENKCIQVYQPKSLKCEESISIVKDLRPDIIIVVAYGKILPKEILDIPKFGCVNVHASLLPKYRGAAPIQWSIINGEVTTGVTTMYMDEGLDTGDIILTKKTNIGDNETSGDLFKRLSGLGAELLIETLKQIEGGGETRTEQCEDEATYAPILDKSYSPIDWNKPARDIHNLIRGLNPWPSAVTLLDGKSFKVHSSKLSRVSYGCIPGEVASLKPFLVGCADGEVLEITEVQAEGKKRMSISDFLCGYHLDIGSILGK